MMLWLTIVQVCVEFGFFPHLLRLRVCFVRALNVLSRSCAECDNFRSIRELEVNNGSYFHFRLIPDAVWHAHATVDEVTDVQSFD